MLPALLIVASIIPNYHLKPWSPGLLASTDSITIAWTMPTLGVVRAGVCKGDTLLHSWLRAEVWYLPKFHPGWPVQWNPQRLYTTRDTFPGAPMQLKLRTPGHGSLWVEAVNQVGRSCPSNYSQARNSE